MLLPFLEVFDIRKLAILGVVKVQGTRFAYDVRGVAPAALWEYVGVATVYAAAYAAFALSAGLFLFHRRELGGGDE
jgi:Flp pilus assembly protein protease CpaA